MTKTLLFKPWSLATIVLLLVCAWSSSVTPIGAQAADLAEKTREGLAEYKRQNYQKAVDILEDVLAKNPGAAEARRVRDEIGLEMSREFIENNLADPSLRARLRQIGHWFVKGREDQSLFSRISDDPEGVKRFVDEYMGEINPVKEVKRAEVLRSKYGEFIVPYVQQRYLHDDAPDVRRRASSLLSAMGVQAVLPLIQIMQSANPLDREYAAHALGYIRDKRALPVLRQHYDDPAQPQGVRQACIDAIVDIMTNENPRLPSASRLWYLQAESYYLNAAREGSTSAHDPLAGSMYPGHLPVLMENAKRVYPVWRWIPEGSEGQGSLVFEQVPLWNYYDVLAEECAIIAVNMLLDESPAGEKANAEDANAGTTSASGDTRLVDAMALLACISVRQYTTGQARLAEGDIEERDFLGHSIGEWGVPRFKHLFGYAAALGSPILYRAVERSLVDGYPDVAVALCDALLAVDDASVFAPQALPTGASSTKPTPNAGASAAPASAPMYAPLLTAIQHADRRIRYAGARALIGLGRAASYGANNTALEKFSDSLAETASRTVLVIAENMQVRTRYVSVLEKRGFAVAAYDSLEEGIHQVTQSPIVDAIVLEAEIAAKPTFYWAPSPSALEGDSDQKRVELPVKLLLEDIRTRNIPLLLACDETRLDTYTQRFQDFVKPQSSFTDDSFHTYGTDVNFAPEDLVNKLDIFFNRNTESRISSTNAHVERAARVLLMLDPNATSYSAESILRALGASIGQPSGRTSSAKIELARAIGHFAAWRSPDEGVAALVLAQLVDILAGSAEVDDPAVRASVSEAIGQLYLYHPRLYQPDGKAFEVLLATMRLQHDVTMLGEDKDDLKRRLLADVERARNAAGVALGKMPLGREERRTMLNAQRASRHIPFAAQGKAEGAAAHENEE